MRALATVLPIAFALASAPALGEDPAAAVGKQRAAASRLAWDIHDGNHPTLGSVRFALMKTPVTTAAGSGKVYSNVYVSCEKNARTIAIELTNQVAPDDPGGLRPARMPRLVCKKPAAGGAMAQELIDATWQTNPLGDAMARGFKPSALRACASIGIVEEVALPSGWGRASAPVEFEITPYARELDTIFATCGEVTAYASAAVAAPSARPPGVVSPRQVGDPRAGGESRAAESGAWRAAHTVAGGTTNVRAGPTLHSAVVARLDAGAGILVQSTGTEWWKAKSRTGKRFQGYIREDRLVLK